MSDAPTTLGYRILHFTRERFPYVMLAVVMIEFGLAFLCVFTFPPGALVMLFVGFVTLAFAVAGNGLLGYADDAMVRNHHEVRSKSQ